MTALSQAEATELFRRKPERYLDVGGAEVGYRRVGSGPDVLFVHGWPVSGATFRKLLPHLAPHVTCHVLDLPGAGDSRFDRDSDIAIQKHIDSVRTVVDTLGLGAVAVVGHDSGGMIARHAMAGDPRMRAMALVDTEQPQGLNFRFEQFLVMSKMPGFKEILGWAGMKPGLRRSKFLLGDAFADRSLLEGEFEELFLAPLRDNEDRLWAAGQLIRSFDKRFVTELGDLHQKIDVPVRLVWGEKDPFFPLAWAEQMVDTFADATLHVVKDAKLFVHEEFAAEVADAMLPTLVQP